MENNSNFDKVQAAVLENPEKAFGYEFSRSGRHLVNRKGGDLDAGKIRIDTVTGVVHYNGGSREAHSNIIKYLERWHLNAAGTQEALAKLADLYGITLEYTPEERAAIGRETLAREIVPYFIEALRQDPEGPAARYLKETRKLEPGTYFGELTAESLKRAKEGLKMRGIKYTREDLLALGLTPANAAAGFNLVIPYYHNGQIKGLQLRQTDPGNPDRYRKSGNYGAAGWCMNLKAGEPAVIVEGDLDAIRLLQAGAETNVIAMGGATPSEDLARTLRRNNITEITYIPDWEKDPDTGRIRNDIALKAVEAFQGLEIAGKTVLKAVYIAELPAPAPEDLQRCAVYKAGKLDRYKQDADSYGRDNGAEALLGVLCDLNTVEAWRWQMNRALLEELPEKGGELRTRAAVRRRFEEIYSRANWAEKAEMKAATGQSWAAELAAYGITPAAVDNLEKDTRNQERTRQLQEGSARLARALEEKAAPAELAGIVRRLGAAVEEDTREDWRPQLTEPFEAALESIKEQPETLKTGWKIGNIGKDGTFYRYGEIEFYPASIAVFCAPTSHGKTSILMQAAHRLALRYQEKTFIFVSVEENRRQLLERSLNLACNIEANEKGETSTGEYCFIRGTRKKAIKAAIRGADALAEYSPVLDYSESFTGLKRAIKMEIERYGRQLAPRLKFIHSEAGAETLTENIMQAVEDYKRAGIEIGAIFVDYLQLLQTEGRNFSRQDEIKEICKALAKLAKETELAIICAAQLNRESTYQRNGGGGIDAITAGNLGEGADIERIAHDIYLVLQTNLVPLHQYTGGKGDGSGELPIDSNKVNAGTRARRIFTRGNALDNPALKAGYMYVEQLKARASQPGGWALLPFDGERGTIGDTDTNKMAE